MAMSIRSVEQANGETINAGVVVLSGENLLYTLPDTGVFIGSSLFAEHAFMHAFDSLGGAFPESSTGLQQVMLPQFAATKIAAAIRFYIENRVDDNRIRVVLAQEALRTAQSKSSARVTLQAARLVHLMPVRTTVTELHNEMMQQEALTISPLMLAPDVYQPAKSQPPIFIPADDFVVSMMNIGVLSPNDATTVLTPSRRLLVQVHPRNPLDDEFTRMVFQLNATWLSAVRYSILKESWQSLQATYEKATRDPHYGFFIDDLETCIPPEANLTPMSDEISLKHIIERFRQFTQTRKKGFGAIPGHIEELVGFAGSTWQKGLTDHDVASLEQSGAILLSDFIE